MIVTNFNQVLVCAPSNVAVDQLAEKISATGLKVRHFPHVIQPCSCFLRLYHAVCGAYCYADFVNRLIFTRDFSL